MFSLQGQIVISVLNLSGFLACIHDHQKLVVVTHADGLERLGVRLMMAGSEVDGSERLGMRLMMA